MTELRGVTWRHPRGYDSVLAAAAAYRSVKPDVTIRWEVRSLQAFADQPLAQLCDSYDLLVIDHPHIAQAAHDGLLTALDGAGFDASLADLATNSVGPSYDSYRVAGRTYALPIDAAAQVAVVRPDLLASPPRTWSEVIDLARHGRVLWPIKPIDAYSSLLTFAASLGRPAFTGGTFLDEATGLEALDLMCGLARLVPPQCLAHDPIDTAELMATTDNWSYAPLVFGYTNYSRSGFRPRRLRYVEPPAAPRPDQDATDSPMRTLLGGAGIAVSSSSAHREAAVAHAFWLASRDVQRGPYFTGGGQPAHLGAWNDATLDAQILGFFSGTRRTMDLAWTRPKHRRYMAFQDEVSPRVTEVLAGKADPTQFLVAANELAAALLDDGEVWS